MFHKEAKLTRQSPLQKAAGWGENVLRGVATAKSIYEAGKTIYSAGQVIAPYVQAGLSML